MIVDLQEILSWFLVFFDNVELIGYVCNGRRQIHQCLCMIVKVDGDKICLSPIRKQSKTIPVIYNGITYDRSNLGESDSLGGVHNYGIWRVANAHSISPAKQLKNS